MVFYLICLTSTLVKAQDANVQFVYDFETKETLPEFFEFQTHYEIFENPDQGGINPSLLVGRVKKLNQAIGWSGIAMTNQSNINLQNGGYLKIKVFATTQMGTVQVKLEMEPRSQQVYALAEITELNQWQELVFKYRKLDGLEFSRVVIIFDLGNVEEHTYYFDDIIWVNGEYSN